MSSSRQSWWSHSLVHFLAIGGLLFALSPAPPSASSLTLRRADLQALYDVQARHLGVKALNASQKAEVKARYIEDQLLYKEALRLGLDREDGIVKRRLAQKMLFLSQQLRGANNVPTEAQLRAHYQKTKERWQQPGVYHFTHIFVRDGQKARLKRLRQEAIRLTSRGSSASSQPTTKPLSPPLGDAFPLGRDIGPTPLPKLRTLFGKAFVKILMTLKPRHWSQPIRSRLGLHVLYIYNKQASTQATFTEAREQVRFDFVLQRKVRVQRQLRKRLSARYRIVWVP